MQTLCPGMLSNVHWHFDTISIFCCKYICAILVLIHVVTSAIVSKTPSGSFAGKTALHWAAAVNNLEAAIALLQHGAKRDVQDDRNQTPLFIAAREGSYEVAQLLLENMANSKMPDQMDMLPRDIAAERKHEHVVSLLDNFSAKPLSTVANTQPPDVMLPSYIRQMVKRKREQQESKEVRMAEIPVTSSQTRQPAIISSSEAACRSKKKGQSFAGRQDSIPGNCSKNKGTGSSTAVQERKSAKNGSNKQCGNTSKPDAPESHTALPCHRYNVESVSVSKSGELSVPTSVPNQWACRSVDTDRYDVNQNCTSGPASSLLATNAAVWRYEELSPPDSNGPASPNLASNGIHSSPGVKFAGHALAAEIRPPDRKKLSGKDQSVSSNRCHQPSSPPKNVEVVRHCAGPEKPLLSATGSHLNSNLIGFDVRGQLIDTSSFPFTIQQYSAPPSLQDNDLPIILQPSSFHALEHCMTPSPDVLAEPWSGPSSSCSVQSEWIDLSSTTQPTSSNRTAANRNVAGTGIKPLCSK